MSILMLTDQHYRELLCCVLNLRLSRLRIVTYNRKTYLTYLTRLKVLGELESAGLIRMEHTKVCYLVYLTDAGRAVVRSMPDQINTDLVFVQPDRISAAKRILRAQL